MTDEMRGVIVDTTSGVGGPLTPSDIRFYRANERPYGAFSNLFRRDFYFHDGTRERRFATREHAYQFGKPRDPRVAEWVISAPKPHLVAMAGHNLLTWDIRPGWSSMKVNRMRDILRQYFDQHADHRNLLLSTGEARIVESGAVKDKVNLFWGEVDGRGKNTLGVLLMELRTSLAEQAFR